MFLHGLKNSRSFPRYKLFVGQHTNFGSILESSEKKGTFVVHTNFQVEISDDTRIFSRRTQNLFWSKNQLSDKISQTFFPT